MNLDSQLELDCRAVLAETRNLGMADDPSLTIVPATGGLFNYVLRCETDTRVVYFKQFGEQNSTAIFSPPKSPRTTRANLAYAVQAIAQGAMRAPGRDSLCPRLLSFDQDRAAILMESTAGRQPLIELLSHNKIPSVVTNELPRALAAFHRATYGLPWYPGLLMNTEFRDFKLKLQYADIATSLGGSLAQRIEDAAARYGDTRLCLVHGDLNSRNVLLSEDHSAIGVIDFEQAHIGSPAYDIAYLLSELYISTHSADDPAAGISGMRNFLDQYFSAFPTLDRETVESEITTHLGIQVLYRFLGPSRNSWTFYVSESARERVMESATSLMMSATEPVSSALVPRGATTAC